ncbi:MAG TPA: endonuclease, partial [Pseudonocardia sp.]
MQEVGEPAALKDLAGKLAGYADLATADPDERGIRVGFLSKLALGDTHQVATFPAPLRPVQVDDTADAVDAMGRPALVATVTTSAGTSITLITCHLKSKLLTFPGGAFSTRDEG